MSGAKLADPARSASHLRFDGATDLRFPSDWGEVIVTERILTEPQFL
jgi:hypothetical protein